MTVLVYIGRSFGKALTKFNIDEERWHELAAHRSAWRESETLRCGYPPSDFRPRLPTPPPEPLARTKPKRAAATATNIGLFTPALLHSARRRSPGHLLSC